MSDALSLALDFPSSSWMILFLRPCGSALDLGDCPGQSQWSYWLSYTTPPPPPRATGNDYKVLCTHVQRTVDPEISPRLSSLCDRWLQFNIYSHIIFNFPPEMQSVTDYQGAYQRHWFFTNNLKCWSPPCQLPKNITSDHFTVLIQPVTLAVKPAKRLVTFHDTRDSAIKSFGRWMTAFSSDHFYSIASCVDKCNYISQVP